MVLLESNFVHQNPFSGANSNSAINANHCFLLNPILHYLAHNISPFERTTKRKEDIPLTTLSLHRNKCARVLASFQGSLGNGLWPNFENHADICLKELRKTTKYLGQMVFGARRET